MRQHPRSAAHAACALPAVAMARWLCRVVCRTKSVQRLPPQAARRLSMLCMPACSLMGGQALQSRCCNGISLFIRVALLRSKNNPQRLFSPSPCGKAALRAPLAQWSEQWSYEPSVVGPSPTGSTACTSADLHVHLLSKRAQVYLGSPSSVLRATVLWATGCGLELHGTAACTSADPGCRRATAPTL